MPPSAAGATTTLSLPRERLPIINGQYYKQVKPGSAWNMAVMGSVDDIKALILGDYNEKPQNGHHGKIESVQDFAKKMKKFEVVALLDEYKNEAPRYALKEKKWLFSSEPM